MPRIFTSTSLSEAEQLRKGILAREDHWCVTIASDCVGIVEEDARQSGDEPFAGPADYTGSYVAFSLCVPAVLGILYCCGCACVLGNEAEKKTDEKAEGADAQEMVRV